MDDFVDSLLPPSASCMLLYPFSNELKKEKKKSFCSFVFVSSEECAFKIALLQGG